MKRFGPWPLCAALAILLLALGWTPMQRLDLLSYDVLAPARHPAAIDDVVVVAIDDASLARLGQWPWSRRVHAQMIDRLREGGAAAIAYDVLWVEPSADDGADRALAEAIRSDARVVLPVAPAPSSSIAGGITPLAPLNELADAARALGHVDVEVDLDGLARRVYLEAGTGTTRWTAFALAGSATSASTLPGRRAPGIDGAREASWYRDHEVLVPRIAAPLAQLAFATLLQEPAQAAALRGKTVFVGATASGLGTDLATPFSTSRTPTPAVLFHANTHVAWRDGSLITPLGLVAQLLLVLPVFVLLALWAPQYRRSRSIVVAASIALPIVLSAALLHAANVWFAPLSATIALVVGNLWWRVGQLRDAARQLFRARAQAEATLQAIADAVIRVDPQQRIDYANPVAQSMSGRQVLTGIPVGDLFDANPAHRQLVTAAARRMRGTARDRAIAGTRRAVDTERIDPPDAGRGTAALRCRRCDRGRGARDERRDRGRAGARATRSRGHARCADQPAQSRVLPRPAAAGDRRSAPHGTPGRGALHRPRSLQADQRQPRPQVRRPGAVHGGRAAAPSGPRQRHGRSIGAATSSSSC